MAKAASVKTTASQRRSYRTRNKIRKVNIDRVGRRETRPRLSVYRSGKQIYAQVIDDLKGVTLAAASTLDKELKDSNEKSGAYPMPDRQDRTVFIFNALKKPVNPSAKGVISLPSFHYRAFFPSPGLERAG